MSVKDADPGRAVAVDTAYAAHEQFAGTKKEHWITVSTFNELYQRIFTGEVASLVKKLERLHPQSSRVMPEGQGKISDTLKKAGRLIADQRDLAYALKKADACLEDIKKGLTINTPEVAEISRRIIAGIEEKRLQFRATLEANYDFPVQLDGTPKGYVEPERRRKKSDEYYPNPDCLVHGHPFMADPPGRTVQCTCYRLEPRPKLRPSSTATTPAIPSVRQNSVVTTGNGASSKTEAKVVHTSDAELIVISKNLHDSRGVDHLQETPVPTQDAQPSESSPQPVSEAHKPGTQAEKEINIRTGIVLKQPENTAPKNGGASKLPGGAAVLSKAEPPARQVSQSAATDTTKRMDDATPEMSEEMRALQSALQRYLNHLFRRFLRSIPTDIYYIGSAQVDGLATIAQYCTVAAENACRLMLTKHERTVAAMSQAIEDAIFNIPLNDKLPVGLRDLFGEKVLYVCIDALALCSSQEELQGLLISGEEEQEGPLRPKEIAAVVPLSKRSEQSSSERADDRPAAVPVEVLLRRHGERVPAVLASAGELQRRIIVDTKMRSGIGETANAWRTDAASVCQAFCKSRDGVISSRAEWLVLRGQLLELIMKYKRQFLRTSTKPFFKIVQEAYEDLDDFVSREYNLPKETATAGAEDDELADDTSERSETIMSFTQRIDALDRRAAQYVRTFVGRLPEVLPAARRQYSEEGVRQMQQLCNHPAVVCIGLVTDQANHEGSVEQQRDRVRAALAPDAFFADFSSLEPALRQAFDALVLQALRDDVRTWTLENMPSIAVEQPAAQESLRSVTVEDVQGALLPGKVEGGGDGCPLELEEKSLINLWIPVEEANPHELLVRLNRLVHGGIRYRTSSAPIEGYVERERVARGLSMVHPTGTPAGTPAAGEPQGPPTRGEPAAPPREKRQWVFPEQQIEAARNCLRGRKGNSRLCTTEVRELWASICTKLFGEERAQEDEYLHRLFAAAKEQDQGQKQLRESQEPSPMNETAPPKQYLSDHQYLLRRLRVAKEVPPLQLLCSEINTRHVRAGTEKLSQDAVQAMVRLALEELQAEKLRMERVRSEAGPQPAPPEAAVLPTAAPSPLIPDRAAEPKRELSERSRTALLQVRDNALKLVEEMRQRLAPSPELLQPLHARGDALWRDIDALHDRLTACDERLQSLNPKRMINFECDAGTLRSKDAAALALLRQRLADALLAYERHGALTVELLRTHDLLAGITADVTAIENDARKAQQFFVRDANIMDIPLEELLDGDYAPPASPEESRKTLMEELAPLRSTLDDLAERLRHMRDMHSLHCDHPNESMQFSTQGICGKITGAIERIDTVLQPKSEQQPALRPRSLQDAPSKNAGGNVAASAGESADRHAVPIDLNAPYKTVTFKEGRHTKEMPLSVLQARLLTLIGYSWDRDDLTQHGVGSGRNKNPGADMAELRKRYRVAFGEEAPHPNVLREALVDLACDMTPSGPVEKIIPLRDRIDGGFVRKGLALHCHLNENGKNSYHYLPNENTFEVVRDFPEELRIAAATAVKDLKFRERIQFAGRRVAAKRIDELILQGGAACADERALQSIVSEYAQGDALAAEVAYWQKLIPGKIRKLLNGSKGA